jgi:erythromycin esterase-like protein
MAENVRWVMQRERGRGRVLVFAHVMHVKNAPTVGGPWRFDRPPTVMGQFLRRALGDSMVVVGSAGGGRAATMQGTIDAVLARVGRAPFLLDFRRARSDEHVLDWLKAEHRLGINGDATIVLKPATAFDALVYFGTLTPARPNPR